MPEYVSWDKYVKEQTRTSDWKNAKHNDNNTLCLYPIKDCICPAIYETNEFSLKGCKEIIRLQKKVNDLEEYKNNFHIASLKFADKLKHIEDGMLGTLNVPKSFIRMDERVDKLEHETAKAETRLNLQAAGLETERNKVKDLEYLTVKVREQIKDDTIGVVTRLNGNDVIDNDLLKRVKALEEWRKQLDLFYHLSTNNAVRAVDKLYKLEDWQKSTGGSILARLKYLEDWKQSEISVHGKVQRLEGKVKDLEERYNAHDMELYEGTVGLCRRVDDLEKQHENAFELENQQNRRIQDLENNQSCWAHVDEVKALEEWHKDNPLVRNTLIQNILERLTNLEGNRVKVLEEWKQNHYELCSRGFNPSTNWNAIIARLDKLEQCLPSRFLKDMKVIDKKVWEEIKQSVKRLSRTVDDYHCPMAAKEIGPLKDAIKKVDPEFGIPDHFAEQRE